MRQANVEINLTPFRSFYAILFIRYRLYVTTHRTRCDQEWIAHHYCSQSKRSGRHQARKPLRRLPWRVSSSLYRWSFFAAVSRQKTYGVVMLSSPEIFTRERLVNDRFREAGWLSDQLKNSDQIDIGPIGSISTATSTNVSVSAGSSPSPSSPPAKASSPPAAGEKPQADSTLSNAPPVSPRDRLKDRVDYREQIRTLLIENQLDDRHDLNGMSLFSD